MMSVYPAQTLNLPASVVTVGAFDGVHLGHQALIGCARERAKRLGVPVLIYTFDPPPKSYFTGDPMLTPLAEKVRRMEALGVDHAVVAHFDSEYASRGAGEFVQELGELNPLEVWIGPNFRFGAGREGDVDTLKKVFDVRVHEPVVCEAGEVISSSRIRGLLARGIEGEGKTLLGWGA